MQKFIIVFAATVAVCCAFGYGRPASAMSRQQKADGCSFRAGVVNHHTLAAELMDRFFSDVARCRPRVSRFIILSPDHFRATAAPITTQTRKSPDLLAAVPSAKEDDRPFLREHGINALLPFIANANLGQSPAIIPLIINPRISSADARRLAQWLKGEIKDGAFLVVSSDMSHDLKKEDALQNDVVTRLAFKDKNTDFFWSANDGFTDNGKAIWIAMAALGMTRWNETSHSISTVFGGTPFRTTSYITGFWE